MLYRIITEDINRNKVVRCVSKAFSGFTLVYGTGYWRGKAESTLIIEIDTLREAGVKRLATEIKELNKQEAVLVQSIECGSDFI